MYVAELRYIQSIHENGGLKGPDHVVGSFLPLLRRWRCEWLRQGTLTALRADPFYYYLLARTIYYDQLFVEAIAQEASSIIDIGCGTDTRAYRFEQVLRQNNVTVMECDQPEAIAVKERMVKKVGKYAYITYAAVDLNDDSWPEFEHSLTHLTGKTFILMEGVSPYINENAFRGFLALLGRRLTEGSRVAYDFKLRGVADTFGLGGRTAAPFRLSWNKDEVAEYHEKLGFRVNSLQSSTDLSAALPPRPAKPCSALFKEDGLVQLEVTGRS